MFSVNDGTAVAVRRSWLVPSPIWPVPFLPQQYNDPSAMTAHEWPPPAEICATLPSVSSSERLKALTKTKTLTATGVCRWLVVLSPSWPKLFWPQQRAVPSATTAQVWKSPPAIPPVLVRPITVSGSDCELVVPSPSSPAPLPPQQRA